MNNGFEYIDIILLAMIAGFIFLRLRGILEKNWFEGKIREEFKEEFTKNVTKKILINKISTTQQRRIFKWSKNCYETIITDFSDNDNKLTDSRPLLSKKVYDQFNQALQERSKRGHYAEITFIGVNSAVIKEHKNIDEILKVTVDFVSEVITCIKDKNKNIISGDPKKIKKIHDTWVFSRISFK